ncbi:MAG TPA: [FeFe] hydrogenase H-cluster maturation GTPase HydF [Bacteroidales bacterium]
MAKGKDAKPHIGIFGRRNNGKSSIINVLAGQDVAIVSDIAGTTTDPVKKSMEVPGIGPIILIDTAGIDDTGDLGKKRMEKSLQVLKTVDAAMLIITDNIFGAEEQSLIEEFNSQDLPFLIIHNKTDLHPLSESTKQKISLIANSPVLEFSASHPDGLERVVNTLREIIPESAYQSRSLIGDLVKHGDTVLLITPIDIEAPEGRLILPQIQVIRDILDNDCIAVVAKEREIDAHMKRLQPRPALVITDSQVFPKADASIPKDIPLTSFSIILARHKGDFHNYLKGTPHLSNLKDGDRVLILESCTHHVSCDDIGRVKIPRWLSNYCGKKLEFDVVAGLGQLPYNIHDYAMVIQCGGCMITRRQITNRLKPAVDAGIPVTNYGMTIAWVHGIYERAVTPFTKVEAGVDYL